jgi:pantetheine-phosphate adenylyltransferase
MKALICGSFDPVTNGHLDIIKRSARIFDSVVVGVFINAEKKYFFDIEKRVGLLKEAVKDFKNVSVDFSSGFVADYVRENNIDVIVKGIRNTSDYEYELEISKVNKKIYKNAETLFMPSSDDVGFISSSLVKKLFSDGEDISSYVPECVNEAFLKTKSL